jgi:chitinase
MSRLFHRLVGPHPPPVPYASKPTNFNRGPSKPQNADILRVNAVYYPNYRVYRGDTPATLNYDCITHVFYAFAHVNPDGGVYVCLPLTD